MSEREVVGLTVEKLDAIVVRAVIEARDTRTRPVGKISDEAVDDILEALALHCPTPPVQHESEAPAFDDLVQGIRDVDARQPDGIVVSRNPPCWSCGKVHDRWSPCPHPITTCFADLADMGEEWTYCPFCGGALPYRAAHPTNSAVTPTTEGARDE